MECLMQYLDDLEDLVYALVLAAERIRRGIRAVAVAAAALSLQVLSVLLALAQPPLALALVSLLSVSLLYRAVVNHAPVRAVNTLG